MRFGLPRTNPKHSAAFQDCGQRRSAGFQPAVSPISNRQNVVMSLAPGLSGHPQAGSTALQSRRGGRNMRYAELAGLRQRPCGAFTLAEVMAALVFMAILIPVALEGL